ncbi:succinate dehydrogenase assembly factor 2 [Thiolinea disciformis]|uniref:FAD assembly factor SdhE n=1 Tax=Thiolinea disciformis TaxID=125614 RepID=UPI00037581B2|nr:succinate dehydrogenase assembly factor 2 [Thiolinea disciformis]
MSELSRYKLRCRRGMKELDVVLERYLQRHFPVANEHERQQFDALLELQDPVLFGILFGLDPTPEPYLALVEKIRAVH